MLPSIWNLVHQVRVHADAHNVHTGGRSACPLERLHFLTLVNRQAQERHATPYRVKAYSSYPVDREITNHEAKREQRRKLLEPTEAAFPVPYHYHTSDGIDSCPQSALSP
jgi:hypothetical protein